MSKKTLNETNLASLGADRLAALLIEVSTGSADIKRRLRLELSHNLGAFELAHDVRKRLVALRKSKSYVSWRKRKSMVTDLNTQVTMIVDKIALDDPDVAFDLLWQFVELAPSIFDRVDDRRGDIGDVFRAAILHFEDIAPRAQLDIPSLSDRVWAAISDNGHGEWDDIIGLLAPTLGEEGLGHLKEHILNFANTPMDDEGRDHAAFQFLRDLRGGRDVHAERKAAFVKRSLQEIAEVLGDTTAYVAQFTPDDLKRKSVAAEIAMLMLAENQPDKALAALEHAGANESPFAQEPWDDAYIATLIALGQDEQAQEHRWGCFMSTLSAPHLRDFLKTLPDFEDIEAEDRARAHVLSFPDMAQALHFCLAWPDLTTAAQLITARANEIDGDHYEFLNKAAEVLRERYPLATTLLLRAMIDFALFHGRSSRYGHAADHLKDCEAMAGEIQNYGNHPTHDEFVGTLRDEHEHKTSFWAKI